MEKTIGSGFKKPIKYYKWLKPLDTYYNYVKPLSDTFQDLLVSIEPLQDTKKTEKTFQS